MVFPPSPAPHSGAAAEIDKAAALQKELGHSGTMQRKYISRGGWSH